jgi:glutathione S-transferase
MQAKIGFVLAPSASREFFGQVKLVSPSGLNTRARFAQATMAPAMLPSWTDLDQKVPQPDFVRGVFRGTPTKLWQTERLYDTFHSSDVRLVLYRDSGVWCPYCERVQLLLELKKVPYAIFKDNMRCYGRKSEEYLALVPSGLLPAVKIDGQLFTESLDIMFEVERTFSGLPYKKSIEADDDAKMQSFHTFVRLERIMAGAWFNMLRGSMSTSGKSVDQFNLTMDLVENALGEYEGPFFLSYAEEGPSFIDCLFVPFVERIISSSAYWRGLDVLKGRPSLTRWMSAMLDWPVFANHRSDDLTHVLALPPQIGRVTMLGPRNEISVMIDRRRSLHVLNDGPERAEDRKVAAAAVVRNYDLVVPDSMKGGSAQEKDKPFVDIAFRYLVQAFLDPDQLESIESSLQSQISSESRATVASCLRFTRGRCCTPRDMSVDALEQFCGGLNWLIGALGEQP